VPPLQRAVVLSDLHLGPDNLLSTFRDEVALAALLRRFAEEAEAPRTELILAGDLFDFLQTEGYDGFDAARSVARLEAILSGRRTAAVMEALRRWAGRPDLEITVLAGNHDPEMLLPEVRRRFEAVIGRSSGSVFYGDDAPLRPAGSDDSPALWGREVGKGERKVWVVHGDRWDPLNWIDRGAALAAIREGRPVELPVGSHLVFEILQKLKPANPWIDSLKPEMAVFLLLFYLDPATTMAFLTRHRGISAGVFRGQLDAVLRRGPLFEPTALEAPAETAADPSALLAEWLGEEILQEPKGRQAFLVSELDGRLRGGARPAPGTLADHSGLGRLLLRAWLRRLRAADRFQALDGSDAIPGAARRFLPESVSALVAGHTHGPRVLRDLEIP
jgi:UDP-2,3-diacylglucosamine pyrophosphatase LpxH